MAKSFVSAGVFTSETDASFLGVGVGSIGAGIIGTAPVGPAFVPVTVSSFEDYASYFGDLHSDHLLGYAARAYLRNAGTAQVVRVLGPSGRTVNGSEVTAGYNAESIWSIIAGSGSTSVVAALLEVTSSSQLRVTDLTNDEFYVVVTGSTVPALVAVTASMLSGSANYISKVLNTDPTKFSEKGYYVRDIYNYAVAAFRNGNATYSSASHSVVTNFSYGYSQASTPWIKSQQFGGSTEYNLFRFHTLGHGEAENGRFKISITNVKPSTSPSITPFGRFDLQVRNFGDSDRNPSIVETFPNLSLDPADPNYVLSAIGDRYWTYDANRNKMVDNGNYPNFSKYIRVEITTGSYADESLPWGFRGLEKANLTISGSASGISDLPYVSNLTDKETLSEAQTYVYWGLETVVSGSVRSRLTKYAAMTGSDADFSLANVSGSSLSTYVYNPSNPSSNKKSPSENSNATGLDSVLAKFTVPLAFGFDGFDRRLNNPLENETQLLAVSQLGTQAVRQAIDILSDPDFVDINLLNIAGIHSSKVTDYAIQKTEDRADCFYIMDVTGSTVDAVCQEVRGRGFDTNYAGVYYPSVKVRDDVNGGVKTLPASIVALGAIAFNDRVAFPWFAPAGLNRAGLSKDTIGFDVLGVTDGLKATERDKLYENRINPIARFTDVPGGVIWGQKTLQQKASALDRINVRRLMIKAKKIVSSAVKYLVFEPSNIQTQERFRNLVNPIFADIQSKNGIEMFKVVFDSTTNTPAIIDQNAMAGKIFLVPTKSAERIFLDFVITRTGASFGDE